MTKSEEWLYRLSADEIAELDQALEHARARDLDISGITREDFPLPRLGRVLEPGDIQLLRLWLCPPDGRTLPDCFAPRYGSVEIGRRGGILVPGATLTVPLEPA